MGSIPVEDSDFSFAHARVMLINSPFTFDYQAHQRLSHPFITYGAKLLNADWLRQRACFLNHAGTFGNQEGMIT